MTRLPNTPDDVVHTVDLLIGRNVSLLPVLFVISHLRVGDGRRRPCLVNKG